MTPELAEGRERAVAWLAARGETEVEPRPQAGSILEAASIIELGRDDLLNRVGGAGSVDDERAAALLAITFGRAGDVEVMLELARLVDLGRRDGVVESLGRVMLDQQRPDGSIGHFDVELRLLGSPPGADASARLAATRLFVAACRPARPQGFISGLG